MSGILKPFFVGVGLGRQNRFSFKFRFPPFDNPLDLWSHERLKNFLMKKSLFDLDRKKKRKKKDSNQELMDPFHPAHIDMALVGLIDKIQK